MLEKIHIQNIGLVDDLIVEFGKGITMLSGETGAGKSMLLSSLLLLMGGKISSSSLRHGAKIGSVFAEWDISNNEMVNAWLDKKGLEAEGSVLHLKRVIKEHGKNQCFISSSSVTQKELSECMDFLCEVHTQHEQQTLFKHTSQIELIDRYAGIMSRVEEFNAKLSTLKKKEKLLKENIVDEVSRLREIDYLEFAINEIEDAKLKANEDSVLLDELKKASNSEEILKCFASLDSFLYEEGNLSENMRKVLSVIQNMENLKLPVLEFMERWESALVEFDDIISGLNNEKDKFTFLDRDELVNIENRLGLIEGLKKKYGGSIERIIKFQQESSEKLEVLRDFDEHSSKLEEDIKRERAELETEAQVLHEIRTTQSEKFANEINSILKKLAMQNAIFSININLKEQLQQKGKDELEFIMLSNKGERALPLKNIASGGELSRVMLAIKVVSTKKESLQTLVLDEVEAGIGGKTAIILGEYIHALGQHTQIIGVSHLPAIIATAHTHYKVEKLEVKERTIIQLKKLNAKTKIHELARMISGDPENQYSQEQAKQFLLHFNSS